MMPSGHKAFLVHNPQDVDLLLMHNRTFAAEYVSLNIHQDPNNPNFPSRFIPQWFILMQKQ
jgi:hypothetical protein